MVDNVRSDVIYTVKMACLSVTWEISENKASGWGTNEQEVIA